MTPPPPLPPDSGWLSWLNAVKGLTLANVLVIAMLMIIAVPVYIIYRAINDEHLLDLFLSSYEEVSGRHGGCILRHVRERGGQHFWGVSTGFAFQGSDQWQVSVILTQNPTNEEIASFCASLKLITDKMLAANGSSQEP